MSSYLELTKPRITVFILMSTAIGFVCGAHGGGAWSLLTLLHTLIGTGLIASGTAALNQWYEREGDVLMRRTSGRPLPAGKMTAPRAMWFGIALAVIGFAELATQVNLLSASLGAFTLASYLFIYTPLK